MYFVGYGQRLHTEHSEISQVGSSPIPEFCGNLPIQSGNTIILRSVQCTFFLEMGCSQFGIVGLLTCLLQELDK